MKITEEIQKLPEEAVQEQVQTSAPEGEDERKFWLDAKYSDKSGDSDR